MIRVADKPVQISEKRKRYTFKLVDDVACDQGSVEARRRFNSFVQEILDTPALLQCGPTFAQEMIIGHNGLHWVLAGKAEADDA